MTNKLLPLGRFQDQIILRYFWNRLYFFCTNLCRKKWYKYNIWIKFIKEHSLIFILFRKHLKLVEKEIPENFALFYPAAESLWPYYSVLSTTVHLSRDFKVITNYIFIFIAKLSLSHISITICMFRKCMCISLFPFKTQAPISKFIKYTIFQKR